MIPPSIRLRRAIQLRSLPLVQRIILSNQYIPNLIRNPDPSDHNYTSLHLAAKHGLVDIADFLLAHGHEEAGISRDYEDVTPLMLAAQAGNDDNDATTKARIEVGKMILTRCTESMLVLDREGMTAFFHACRSGSLPLVQLLLTHPQPPSPFFPDPDTILPPPPTNNATSRTSDWPLPPSTNPTSPPPPAPAAPMPAPEHAQLLSRDNNGNTPLHHASAAGQLKTLRLLISLGADHMAQNNAHWTPVDYSATVAAEVYLRGLVREREGARVLGNISASASDGAAASGPARSDRPATPAETRMGRGMVRLVQSEDEESEAGGAGGGSESGMEVIRGRARTAT